MLRCDLSAAGLKYIPKPSLFDAAMVSITKL